MLADIKVEADRKDVPFRVYAHFSEKIGRQDGRLPRIAAAECDALAFQIFDPLDAAPGSRDDFCGETDVRIPHGESPALSARAAVYLHIRQVCVPGDVHSPGQQRINQRIIVGEQHIIGLDASLTKVMSDSFPNRHYLRVVSHGANLDRVSHSISLTNQ